LGPGSQLSHQSSRLARLAPCAREPVRKVPANAGNDARAEAGPGVLAKNSMTGLVPRSPGGRARGGMGAAKKECFRTRFARDWQANLPFRRSGTGTLIHLAALRIGFPVDLRLIRCGFASVSLRENSGPLLFLALNFGHTIPKTCQVPCKIFFVAVFVRS